MPFSQWINRPWTAPAITGGLALVLRIAYVLDQRSSVLFDAPIMDAAVHDGWARGTIIVFHAGIPYFRAPLYPWFLEALYALNDGYLWPRLVQAVLSALTVALVADVGRRVSGGWAGLVGGGLLALCWSHIYFAGELLIVTLFTTLVVVGLWLLVRAGLDDRPMFAGAGALTLGVASLARPNALVMVPVLVGLAIWAWPKLELSRLGQHRWRNAGILVGLVLLPGLLVTMRNGVVSGDWVFIASQGGVNFYIGNNPQSDGRTAVVPNTRPTWMGGYEDTIQRAVDEMGRPLRPSEVSRYYFGEGLRYWRDDFGGALSLYARKARLLLGAGARSNNKNIYYWRGQSSILRWPFYTGWALIMGLGVVGIFLARRRWALMPVWGFVAMYAAGLMLFFINERFRLPLTVVLATTAGIPAQRAIELVGARRWLRVVAIAASVAALIGLSSLDLIGFRESRTDADAISRYTAGNAYLRKGEPIAAIAEYEEALAIDQRFGLRGFDQVEPMLRIHLAQALYQLRRLEDMAVQLELLNTLAPREALVGALWGHYYRGLGDFERACPTYQSIVNHMPAFLEAQLGLGWCFLDAKDLVGAARAFNIVLEQSPENAEAMAGVGAVRAVSGNLNSAEQQLVRALEINPNLAAAHRWLGDVYFRRSDAHRMTLHLREAVRLDPYDERSRRLLESSGKAQP